MGLSSFDVERIEKNFSMNQYMGNEKFYSIYQHTIGLLNVLLCTPFSINCSDKGSMVFAHRLC